MALGLATIADSISKLSIAGLTIKDIDEIPQQITQRDCPMLIPDPDNFIGFNIEPDTLDKNSWTINYKLNYILIYAAVGAGRTIVIDNYSGMITKAMAIVETVNNLTSLTGAVDWDATAGDPLIMEWGTLSYHACRMIINAVELVN